MAQFTNSINSINYHQNFFGFRIFLMFKIVWMFGDFKDIWSSFGLGICCCFFLDSSFSKTAVCGRLVLRLLKYILDSVWPPKLIKIFFCEMLQSFAHLYLCGSATADWRDDSGLGTAHATLQWVWNRTFFFYIWNKIIMKPFNVDTKSKLCFNFFSKSPCQILTFDNIFQISKNLWRVMGHL